MTIKEHRSETAFMLSFIKEVCEKSYFNSFFEKSRQALKDDFKEFEQYAEWCYQKGFVDRSNTEELLEKIKKCYTTIGIPLKDLPRH